MPRVAVPTNSRLAVSYEVFRAADPRSTSAIVLHHGICHTVEQFRALIDALNARGYHVVMIEQQTANAGFFRNLIGLAKFRHGMQDAVAAITQVMPIGIVVAHSMGALITEEWQQEVNGDHRPLVLMAPIPHVLGALPISFRLFIRGPLKYFKAVLTLDIHSLASTPRQVRELFFDCRTPERTVVTTTGQLTHASFVVYLQLMFRWLRRAIVDDRVPKRLLTSPTDGIFHPGEYKGFAQRYSRMDHFTLLGGHDFFLEFADETADRIAEFFALHGESDFRVDKTRETHAPHQKKKPGRRQRGSRPNDRSREIADQAADDEEAN